MCNVYVECFTVKLHGFVVSWNDVHLSKHLNTAACPSFNMNNPPMRTLLCRGDIITYTCAFNSSSPIVITQWTGSDFRCSNPSVAANTIQLTQSSSGSLNTVPVSCGSLSAVMTNIIGTCYTSVLTITTPQCFNGTTIMCRDGTTLIGNDTLNIQLACKYCSNTHVWYSAATQLKCVNI